MATNKKYNESIADLLKKLQDLFSSKQQPLVSPLPKGATSPNVTPTPSSKPAPTTTKNVASKGLDKSGIEDLLSKTFGEDGDIAKAVAMQESSMNPKARNPQNPDVIGLMQIDVKAHADKIPGKTIDDKINALEDPNTNIEVAKKIYDQQGWSPWEAFTSGAYTKYIAKGQ